MCLDSDKKILPLYYKHIIATSSRKIMMFEISPACVFRSLFTAVMNSFTSPSTNFFHFLKLNFGWTSIKCFYDNGLVYLAAVEFVMETIVSEYENVVKERV